MKWNKIVPLCVVLCTFVLIFTGCQKENDSTGTDDTTIQSSESDIQLNGDIITSEQSSVNVDGTTATISEEGTYTVSGTLNDG